MSSDKIELQTNINIGKEGFELLLINECDSACLTTLKNKYELDSSTLKNYVQRYYNGSTKRTIKKK